jgi:hypothetical protein
MHALPVHIQTLDLSGPDKLLEPHALELLPQKLVSFSCRNWTRAGDNELMRLPKTIRTLDLEGWCLSKTGLNHIFTLPLTSLRLVKCMSDQNEALDHLPMTLKSLDTTAPVANLPDLTTLHLSQLPLSKQDLQFPQSLKTLILHECGPLSKQLVRALSSLHGLTELSLSGCDVQNDDLADLPLSIRTLDLSACTRISDCGAQTLDRLHALQTLILDKCEEIRGSCLAKLSPSIKTLSCQNCTRLSGKSLAHMPQTIQELYLNNCTLIEEVDLQALKHPVHIWHGSKI